VQEQPGPSLFVTGHFGKVIARSQAAQLQLPVRRRALDGRQHVVAELSGQLLQFGDPPSRRVGQPRVVLPGRERDGALDLAPQRRQRAARPHLLDRPRRADGDHAAADVDADRGRDDGLAGGQHRTDRRALAQVGVGHQRDVGVHERQRGGALGLPQGLGVEDAGPVQQLVGEALHSGESPVPERGPRPDISRG
jgi:hypothetical protein